jgi:hypothetical protein
MSGTADSVGEGPLGAVGNSVSEVGGAPIDGSLTGDARLLPPARVGGVGPGPAWPGSAAKRSLASLLRTPTSGDHVVEPSSPGTDGVPDSSDGPSLLAVLGGVVMEPVDLDVVQHGQGVLGEHGQ